MLEIPVSTVSGILKRIGMGQLGRLGMEPAERYERTVAGELIHIDVKKAREDPGRRWEADHGRRLNREPRRREGSGVLRRAIAFYERHGMQVQELLTGNGAPYRSVMHAHMSRPRDPAPNRRTNNSRYMVQYSL